MISKLVKKTKKGFTLMEMLIVVAIIAILVAIMIPTFNAQLEKSREAADAANIRAAYAQVLVEYLDDSAEHSEKVSLQQTGAGWANTTLETNLKNLVEDPATQYTGAPEKGGNCTVSVNADGAVTIAFGAAATDGD